jgi:HSP20 family protein
MTPLTLMRRMLDDLDRVFDEYTPGRFAPPGERDLEPPWVRSGVSWAPKVDVFERDGNLVIRADLPGLRNEDVRVSCTDEAITIEGERRQDREVEGRGVYRAERTYGSFYREIPVPEGADTQRAAANFENGVLEITIPLDEQRTRARRIEVQDRRSAESQGQRDVH